VNLRGAGGVSYFAVLAAPTPKTYARTDTSIWLLGFGKNPQQRIVRRVDDGGVTGVKRYRHEPETCSGPGEVFVYYSVETEVPGKGKIYGLRRCRTGIMQTNTTVSQSSSGPRSIGRERELGLGEALPEEPEQPLRRYLYLNMKDSSICPPIGMGSGDQRGGIVVLDMDHGMKFVKRIGSDLLMNGPCRVSSGPGVRWMHGSAVTDRLYYGYSEPGAKYLRGINAATPAPPNANAIIGCIDLRTDRVLWEQPAHNACCFAVFPDGKRLLAVPDMSQVRHRKLTILDAMTGKILETIDTGCVFHGVAVGAQGRFLFPSVGIGPLLVFDTVTGKAIPLADAYPVIRELDWSSVPELYRRFEALHVVRAYQANGAEDLLWSQLRNGPRGQPRDPKTADGGLILLDLKNRRAAVATLEPALLNNAVEPGRTKKHHFASYADNSIYWYGHGYCAALSPDERWFYHGNFEGDFRVIVWDNSFWPPRPVGIMGEGLSSEPQVDPVSGDTIGCHNKSGAWVSADGRIVFTSDSWYFDARTWKPLGLMRNEHGQIIRCSKMNEVHFRGNDCVYFGQRWGFGRYREPSKIFPPSTDKTPPTAARALTASVSTPEARWSGGDVVVSVALNWKPATDNDGVQRYAVYRDGERIGNCLGKNPGDPVLSEADAVVVRAQVGEVKENSFTARYLKPGQRYRFEVEPIDFAQNRGPRIALDVNVPSVDPQTEDALVKTWAERILARAKQTQAKECAEALTEWLDQKHRSRPWASALCAETKKIVIKGKT
jgi:hypothetical protein